MNIFILDTGPFHAARYHCDKHVVKMILETAQLLSTAHHILDGAESPLAGILYKQTHKNHPCAVWVRESSANYQWAVRLFECLHEEWQFRWNHSHDHKSYGRLMHHDGDHLTVARLPANIPHGPLTPFRQCMPEQYRNPNDPVQAYRDYYVGEKRSILKYTRRTKPFWLADEPLMGITE